MLAPDQSNQNQIKLREDARRGVATLENEKANRREETEEVAEEGKQQAQEAKLKNEKKKDSEPNIWNPRYNQVIGNIRSNKI